MEACEQCMAIWNNPDMTADEKVNAYIDHTEGLEEDVAVLNEDGGVEGQIDSQSLSERLTEGLNDPEQVKAWQRDSEEWEVRRTIPQSGWLYVANRDEEPEEEEEETHGWLCPCKMCRTLQERWVRLYGFPTPRVDVETGTIDWSGQTWRAAMNEVEGTIEWKATDNVNMIIFKKDDDEE